MAERYGDELAAALPEVDAVVGFAGEGSLAAVGARSACPRRKPTGVRDLLELPRPAPSVPWAYVKVAEGCDRGVRVLRHPVVPRQAAVPHPRVDRGRGARPGRRRRRRDRARRAGPRLVRARHRRAGRRSRRCCAGSTRSLPTASSASGSSTSIRARCATRSSSTMLELPTVVPYFDLSLQHADRARCCGA